MAGWHLEKIDTGKGYEQETPIQYRPIYARKIRTNNWDSTQGPCRRILRRNLWGGKSAVNDLIQGIIAFFKSQGFEPADTDPYILVKPNEKDTVKVTITIDEFIIITNRPQHLNLFYDLLTKKYQVKRMRWTSQSLGWSVS